MFEGLDGCSCQTAAQHERGMVELVTEDQAALKHAHVIVTDHPHTQLPGVPTHVSQLDRAGANHA